MIVKIVIGIVIFILLMLLWHFSDKKKIKRLERSIKEHHSRPPQYIPEPVPPRCAVKDCEQRDSGACTMCWRFEEVKEK